MTYQLSLEGKTALITFADQDIGRASAEAFIKPGSSVITTDINEDAQPSTTGLTQESLSLYTAASELPYGLSYMRLKQLLDANENSKNKSNKWKTR